MISRVHPDYPLIVAANRDELFDRPAVAMAVLEDSPRVLGGRDKLAGGTWLAVNRRGVVAALTNRPSGGQKDPSKRSRGELPPALARHETARDAVERFDFRPTDFNPAWLLAGDRTSLYSIDMTGGDEAKIAPLAPGIHILENRELGAQSAKVDHVRRLVEPSLECRGRSVVDALRRAISNHEVPPLPPDEERPAEIAAACVHTTRYGTRWSAIITVPPAGPPEFLYSDGPSCTSPLVDASPLWTR